MAFEALSLIALVLVLIYLAFFSPKFDRFMTRLFVRGNHTPDSADGISDKVNKIEAEKAAAKAAIDARAKTLAAEKAKLDNIQVK